MTPSQAAIADARRNEMTDVYAAVREAAKERHSIAVSESNKRRANAIPSGEQIPPMDDSLQLEDEKLLSQVDGSFQPSPKTRDTRAKAAGTNAKYIDLANQHKPQFGKFTGLQTVASRQAQSGKDRGGEAG